MPVSGVSNPPTPYARPVIRLDAIDFPRGASFSTTADMLEQSGFIKNRLMFYALAFVKGAPNHIRWGEYEFTGSMSPRDILNKILLSSINGGLVQALSFFSD